MRPRKRLFKQLKLRWQRKEPIMACCEHSFKQLQGELYTLLKEAVTEYEGFSGNSIGGRNLIACEGGLAYEEAHKGANVCSKNLNEILEDLEELKYALEQDYEELKEA